MMKKYIAPEFKVAMFHKETVSTYEPVSTDENVTTVSQRALDGNTAAFMNQATNAAKVQKSINFNNAIKFN